MLEYLIYSLQQHGVGRLDPATCHDHTHTACIADTSEIIRFTERGKSGRSNWRDAIIYGTFPEESIIVFREGSLKVWDINMDYRCRHLSEAQKLNVAEAVRKIFPAAETPKIRRTPNAAADNIPG